MTRFDECLPLILAHEGGFTNNPADNGGATNLGITAATLSAWLGRTALVTDIHALTPATVAPIYRKNFWDAAHCGQLPAGVDYMVFDLAVNSGVGRACRYLQRAVSAVEDGAIGPNTLSAVAQRNPKTIIDSIAQYRKALYLGHPDFPTFGHGWLNRLASVVAQAHEMAA